MWPETTEPRHQCGLMFQHRAYGGGSKQVAAAPTPKGAPWVGSGFPPRMAAAVTAETLAKKDSAPLIS